MFGQSVKLADFGWSNHNEKMRNTYCGTPDYLAPEMITRSTHNEKLDVWSLGVLTFEMLTGNAPFTPPNIKERGQKMKALESNITVVYANLRKENMKCLLEYPQKQQI